MANQRVTPLSIVSSSNLDVSGGISVIQDDPDNAGSTWFAVSSDTTDSSLVVDFNEPSGSMTTGSGLQEFRVRVGTYGNGTSPDALAFYLDENGSQVTELYNQSSPTITSASTGGEIISLTWDAASLSSQDPTTAVQLRMVCTADASPPGQACSVGVESIEWNAEYQGTVHEALTAATGSYSVTGVSTTLVRNRAITAATGSYSTTGADADLDRNFVLDAAAGSYSVSGVNVDLSVTVVLPALEAATGSYSISGADSTLLRFSTIDAATGTYSVTGADANLTKHYTIQAASGSYSVAGVTANLDLDSVIPALSAETGTYSITGQTANLTRDLILEAATGGYTVTGADADLNVGLDDLDAETGTYTVTGNSARLTHNVTLEDLDAATGSYSITGSPVTLELTRAIAAQRGSYTVLGKPALITYSNAIPPGSQYNFKKEATLYLVNDPDGANNRYQIDISAINFNQTFVDSSIETKTIQGQEMFEDSRITKANPATFSFTIPVIREDDLKVVVDRALDCVAFDLYIETPWRLYKLDYCVITELNFIAEKLRPLSLEVQGEAARLVHNATLDSSLVPRSASRTYNRVGNVYATLNSVDISENTTAVTTTLTNEIEWVPYQTLMNVCDPTSVSYPIDYTIKGKSFGGSIRSYLTGDNDSNLQTWAKNVPLNIKIGQTEGSFYGFEFNMASCFYQNTLETQNIFGQNYEWRMLDNPTNLNTAIIYHTA